MERNLFADLLHYTLVSVTGLGAVVMFLCGNYFATAALGLAFVTLLTLPKVEG